MASFTVLLISINKFLMEHSLLQEWKLRLPVVSEDGDVVVMQCDIVLVTFSDVQFG